MVSYAYENIVENMNTELVLPGRTFNDGIGKIGPGYFRFITYADEVRYNINND